MAQPTPQNPTDSTSHSRLLSLPTELRLQIWSTVLTASLNPTVHIVRLPPQRTPTPTQTHNTNPSPIRHLRCSKPSPTGKLHDPPCPCLKGWPLKRRGWTVGQANVYTLMRTCRQIHAEIREVLYSHSVFNFDSTAGFCLWASGPQHQRYLKYVRAVRIWKPVVRETASEAREVSRILGEMRRVKLVV